MDLIYARRLAFALIAFLFLFTVSRAHAAKRKVVIADEELSLELENAGARRPADVSATLQTSVRATTPSKSNFSLVLPSFVVHGFAIDKEVADQMPRKLSGGGQTVMTPGVGLQYVSDGGFLALGGILKDCYDNFAGLIQVGQMFKWGSRTLIGYSAGVYMRETPIECKTIMDRRGRKSTACEEFDAYQLKFMSSINGESVDIIPMPFLHFSTALYKDRDFEVDFKVMTNFALNEFGLAIPF